jgi:hypothetical protein
MADQQDHAARAEHVLMTRKVIASQKMFYLDLKENQRGRFLKITEKDGRFRSTVIIPDEALPEVAAILQDVAADLPPAPAADAAPQALAS